MACKTESAWILLTLVTFQPTTDWRVTTILLRTAAGYILLGPIDGVLWCYEIGSVRFGFSQDWSSGGVGSGGSVRWVVFVEELSVGEVICLLVVIWRTACVCRSGVRSGKIKYFPACCRWLVIRFYCCNIYNGKNERSFFNLCLSGIYFVIGSWLLSLGKYSNAYSVY